MKKFRIEVIGLGNRSRAIIKDVLCDMADIVCISDVYEDRRDDTRAMLKERLGTDVAIYGDYREMIENETLDAVYIATSWQTHFEIATDCMNRGIAVAVEVGAAFSLEQCREIVKTYERTLTPIMMMENCCYGRYEMMVMNMIKNGVFGEIVHCSGGYCHDLRGEIVGGRENRHYRLDNYLKRNCENYPTHELGPIAHILDINRGNRMLNVASISSNAMGLNEYRKLCRRAGAPHLEKVPCRRCEGRARRYGLATVRGLFLSPEKQTPHAG